MTQENAEKMLAVFATMMNGLYSSVSRREVINRDHTMRVRTVEVFAGVFIVATEKWSDADRDFHLLGTITAYSEFGGK